MTKLELVELLEEVLPGCKFDIDDNEQLIIRTNRTEDIDGELIELELDLDEDDLEMLDHEPLEDEGTEDDEDD